VPPVDLLHPLWVGNRRVHRAFRSSVSCVFAGQHSAQAKVLIGSSGGSGAEVDGLAADGERDFDIDGAADPVQQVEGGG